MVFEKYKNIISKIVKKDELFKEIDNKIQGFQKDIYKNIFIKNSKQETKKDIENKIKLLQEVTSFTIPDKRLIKNYINIFKELFYERDIITTNEIANNTFEIVDFIGQDSSNGIIYIVKIKKSKSKYAKLLIKVAKNRYADPSSYEYYIGMTLNSLRTSNIQNFSLVYGKFMCGFNEKNIKSLKKDKICDMNNDQKTHILYEYIATESGKSETLRSFIKRMNDPKSDKTKMNIELMNIMLMLMISLQHAQDQLQFTHYDLHLENVLLVKLNGSYKFKYEYKNKTYDIVLEYFPFIIDFGRSHIKPNKVDEIVKEPIIDSDAKTLYNTYNKFKEYQEECWKNKHFVIDPKKENDKVLYQEIIKQLQSKLKNKLFRKKVLKHIKKITNEEYTDEQLNEYLVLDVYYVNNDISKVTNGITPDKFHKAFDFYRLLRSACNIITDSKFWLFLEDELDEAYPFYIPYYYNLPSDYESFSGTFNKPIDIAEYIYDITSEMSNNIKGESIEVNYNQLGGNSKIKGIEKIKKK